MFRHSVVTVASCWSNLESEHGDNTSSHSTKADRQTCGTGLRDGRGGGSVAAGGKGDDSAEVGGDGRTLAVPSFLLVSSMLRRVSTLLCLPVVAVGLTANGLGGRRAGVLGVLVLVSGSGDSDAGLSRSLAVPSQVSFTSLV